MTGLAARVDQVRGHGGGRAADGCGGAAAPPAATVAPTPISTAVPTDGAAPGSSASPAACVSDTDQGWEPGRRAAMGGGARRVRVRDRGRIRDFDALRRPVLCADPARPARRGAGRLRPGGRARPIIGGRPRVPGRGLRRAGQGSTWRWPTTTRRSGSTPSTATPTRTVATPTTSWGSSDAPSRTTGARSSSTRSRRSRTGTAASRTSGMGTRTSRWRTSAGRSSWIRPIPLRTRAARTCGGRAGDIEGSLQDYDEAIRLDPAAYRGARRDAAAPGSTTRTSRARPRTPRLPSRSIPERADGYYLRGLVAAYQGNDDAAVVDYDKVDRHPEPDHLGCGRGSGPGLPATGQHGRRDRGLRPAHRGRGPSSASCMRCGSSARAMGGDEDGAKADFERALALTTDPEMIEEIKAIRRDVGLG